MKQISEAIKQVFQAETSLITRFKYQIDPADLSLPLNYWCNIGQRITGKEYSIHEHRKEIESIILYLHGYEESGLDLTKGIHLTGTVGTGKTTIFRIMNKYSEIDGHEYRRGNKVIPFISQIVSSRQMVADFQTKGYDGIAPYLTRHILTIDDLGSEITEANHYGTRLAVLDEVIERRYLDRLITHISTNLNNTEIMDKYGARVYSRLKSTDSVTGKETNKIKINGKDRR